VDAGGKSAGADQMQSLRIRLAPVTNDDRPACSRGSGKDRRRNPRDDQDPRPLMAAEVYDDATQCCLSQDPDAMANVDA
jgi:hypothetical protein